MTEDELQQLEKDTKEMVERDNETEYQRHKKLMSTVFYEIRNIEQKLIDAQVAFQDAQRAQASGVQNVYDKFIELEQRQKNIENLLNSDRVKTMIELIPNEETVLRMFDMIESHPISLIKEKINSIRDDLEELTDRFTL